MAARETDVLIVGLGPTGAVLAGLLAQWGVRSIAVEREHDVYRQPRAAHFDHEIMRVFQQLGIADAILPHTRPLPAYEFRNAAGELLMNFRQGDAPTSLGWRASYMFHQPAMEEALRARLGQLSEVGIRLGWSLTEILNNDAEGVAAVITSDEGISETIHARFLVGCDGGASPARRMMDIDLFDFGFDEPWLVIDTLVADESRLPPCGLQLCDPKRPTTVMPMAPGRRRWEFMLRPDERPEDMLDDVVITRMISPWLAPGEAEIVRKAVYRFHGLVANSWRKDSVLLAGDAAHQMPPFMGQGMCSGIRDAAALAWRIGMTLRHGAPSAVLDTYQTERDPHVRAIVAMAIHMGRVVCTMDEAAAEARDAALLAQRTEGESRPPALPGLASGFLHPSPRAGEIFPQPALDAGRFDDSAGNGFWLVSRTPQSAPFNFVHTHAADHPDLQAWLDAAGADAALVRPDRYVFGTGTTTELLAALAQSLAVTAP